MATADDIEGFLIRMGVNYETIKERMWMIHDEHEMVDNIVVSLNDPVVLFQVRLLKIPERCDRTKLFETLLSLNTTDMMHGAYGLEGSDAVVATDTLQAENLDFNEFQASVDSLSLCISHHYAQLLPIVKAQGGTTHS